MGKETIAGYKGLDKKLAALGNQKNMVAATKSGINKALTPVVRAARQNVPRGTRAHKTYLGRLVSPGFAARSIAKKVKRKDAAITGTVGVKGEAFYALFFETGTKHMAKKPWLEKSFRDNEQNAVVTFSDGIQAYITRIAKKK